MKVTQRVGDGGGNCPIIGHNSFQRAKESALALPDGIYHGKA